MDRSIYEKINAANLIINNSVSAALLSVRLCDTNSKPKCWAKDSKIVNYMIKKTSHSKKFEDTSGEWRPIEHLRPRLAIWHHKQFILLVDYSSA